MGDHISPSAALALPWGLFFTSYKGKPRTHVRGLWVRLEKPKPRERKSQMRTETTETSRRVRYYADAGGVEVGNDGFAFIVPNGYGDGWHDYVVYEDASVFSERRKREDEGKPWQDQWKFFTSFTNAEDAWVTGGETLSPGRGGAWYRDGDIAIERWD